MSSKGFFCRFSTFFFLFCLGAALYFVSVLQNDDKCQNEYCLSTRSTGGINSVVVSVSFKSEQYQSTIGDHKLK